MGLQSIWHYYSKRNWHSSGIFVLLLRDMPTMLFGTQVEDSGSERGMTKKRVVVMPLRIEWEMTKSPTVRKRRHHATRLSCFSCVETLKSTGMTHTIPFCTSMLSTIHPYHKLNQDTVNTTLATTLVKQAECWWFSFVPTQIASSHAFTDLPYPRIPSRPHHWHHHQSHWPHMYRW
jgi:hypothetical protein